MRIHNLRYVCALLKTFNLLALTNSNLYHVEEIKMCPPVSTFTPFSREAKEGKPCLSFCRFFQIVELLSYLNELLYGRFLLKLGVAI
jgi:hypothetical protein